jgi:hypothetical protein
LDKYIDKRVERRMRTNEEVNTVEQAFEKVRYYVQRWEIERFHLMLKSGCVIEKLQERDMEKTKTLILMYSITATPLPIQTGRNSVERTSNVL